MCVDRLVALKFAALQIVIVLWTLLAEPGLAMPQSAANYVVSRQGAHEGRELVRAREQWFRQGRSARGGNAARLRYRALQQKLRIRAAQRAASTGASSQASASWTSLGPAPLWSDASGTGQQNYNWVSGRATAVAVDPNDPSGNTVYVGGAYGGLWKSSNAGPGSPSAASVQWTQMMDDQPTLAVGAVAVQPGNTTQTSVVLVGTGETNSSSDSYYGLGIFRWTDASGQWVQILEDATGTISLAGIGFSRIAFSTSNPNLVVAAAAGASQGLLDGKESAGETNLGIYDSNDGGQTWNYAAINDGAATVGPGSVTTVVYNAAAQEFFGAVRFHGFYSSSDGVHWQRLANQPGNGLVSSSCPASPTLQTCPIYRGEIAVVPNRAEPNGMGEMYVWYVDANDNDQGIWQTMDGGVTWNAINETGIAECGDLIGGCGTENGTYNLALAAVPNGATATDLYAGAVNLYKCTILNGEINSQNSPPSCDDPGNTFLNLTHAYGCDPLGSIAMVHPAQHGMDFMPLNNGQQVVMYFANDGGIYRAENGYADLTSGTCGTPNQFDSLNQTLGSMTQFVAFAQDPTNQNSGLLLGGTQGNGSPATAQSQVNTQWVEVNAGDGGYTAINPNNPGEWFTENTGMNIQVCEAGSGCQAPDFTTVVSSATVGGDSGPLYTPYMLDPQNSAAMIVGTCRVWRGATNGSGFNVLSNNFDTGSTAACTGNEVNTVRWLAAGGAQDTAGFSSVIYAGTNGSGPQAATPSGGRVWMMTEANGTDTWSDITGDINPEHFPISGIALDPADASGGTAYVTIMGFGISHVWQSSMASGQQMWTDFTGNGLCGTAMSPSPLPDAPANAVLVENGVVYVGTDVGVFASSTICASWSEVGPAPAPGQTGFLPDVAVTGLAMFNDGTNILLRASTYGRGIWQFPLSTGPDFELDLPPAEQTQTAFVGAAASFSGTLDALNGYSETVTLSCAGTSLPDICEVSPGSITPTSATTGLTLTAGSGRAMDYSFALQGQDGNGLMRQRGIELHVVDFKLDVPNTTIFVAPSETSSAIVLKVEFLGSFPASGTVNLSCAAKGGISCNFFPSASVSPAQASPPQVTITAGTQTGSFPVTVTASSQVGAGKTTNETLNVTVAVPTFALSVNGSGGVIAAGQTAMVSGTATALAGYNSAVTLACIAGNSAPPPTCTFAPATVTPGGNGTFNLTLGGGPAGAYSFYVQGTGADGTIETTVTQVTLTLYDFSIVPDANTEMVNAGQQAVYNLTFTPEPMGTTFEQEVSGLACSGLPLESSCVFSAQQIVAGSGATVVKLTVNTTAPSVAARRRRPVLFYALLLPGSGVALVWLGVGRGGRSLAALAAICFVIALLGCGGGLAGNSTVTQITNTGTPPGVYSVTVTATEGTLPEMVTLDLSVQ